MPTKRPQKAKLPSFGKIDILDEADELVSSVKMVPLL